MRLSEGVEWAVHCCTMLAVLPPDRALPAARLAEFHGVPPAYLAKHLQQLVAAGILESVPGRRGGYRLARPAADIPLLDVVQAIDGEEHAFRCTEIRRNGPSAVAASEYTPVCAIAAAMYRAEAAWRKELAGVSVGDIAAGLRRTVPAEAAAKAAQWYVEVTR
jgi:Rrf2 family protein